MTDEPDIDDPPYEEPRRRRWVRAVLSSLLVALAVSLIALWTQRQPIAERFVQQELAARGVQASYQVTQIALRTQRIENLVLGDPRHPDLTAASVEVDLAYGSIIPRVGAVRARGVRLYGRVTDKGLSLGELDKFRDPSSTAPFGLPDIDMTHDDARVRLDTPVGPVGLAINGSGNLRSGFAGKAAALMRDVALGGCSIPRASAWMDIKVTNGAPRLSGPVRADAVRCDDAGMGAADVAVTADVTLGDAFDRWKGRLSGGAQAARGAGLTLAQPQVDMRLDGTATAVEGRGTLGARALGMGDVRAGQSRIKTQWRWKDGKADARGEFAASDVRGIDVSGLRTAARGAASTPVGPLLARLADGVAALQTDNRLRGQFALEYGDKTGSARLAGVDLTGAKGSRAAFSRGSSFTIALPSGAWSLDGGLTTGGGGLPDTAVRLRSAENGALAGQAFVKPYRAGNAMLDVEPIRFVARADGTTRITTRLALDGPMPDGALRGFQMPLVAQLGPRGLVVNPTCVPARFSSLKTGSMRLGATGLDLCPVDGAMLAMHGGAMTGGVAVASPRLAGRLGDTKMLLTARSARYSLRAGGFDLAEADLRLGGEQAPVLLSAAHLDGRALRSGLGGQASGIAARIGTVPLLVRDGAARWSYANDVLALDGSIIVHDDASPDRFNPLESRDFRLRMADGRIQATGRLTLPGHDRTIATVTATHRLSDGAGQANFAMNGLRFDRQLQPDEITHIALGVVANVFGTVNGSGQIDWTGAGNVTSTGTFSTDNTDLAAAFGPVQGLATTIHFTDLIGLVTAPHQEMRVASVHPGIEVREGVIHYALLPDQRVSIEDGHWPFAGGDLTLLPTIMDMSSEKPRKMSFRVVGLQAGAFIQMLELENISATGTFDGLLPMIFDADGGRIDGGILTARQSGMPPLIIDHVEGLDIPCDSDRQGGRLAYVGQVSNEDLGFMGKLAFDALKDLQYKCLTILMDGAIDGEVVTQVAFNGINRGELSTVPKPIASQFVGLPFIFNITIAAPFRGLMNTAKSFVDPSLLIRQQLGDGFAAVPQNRLAVQPSESETMPSGERE